MLKRGRRVYHSIIKQRKTLCILSLKPLKQEDLQVLKTACLAILTSRVLLQHYQVSYKEGIRALNRLYQANLNTLLNANLFLHMPGKVFCTSLQTGSWSGMVLRSVHLLCQWQDHHKRPVNAKGLISTWILPAFYTLGMGASAIAHQGYQTAMEQTAAECEQCPQQHSTDVTQLLAGVWFPRLHSSEVGLSTTIQNLGTGTSVSSHSRHSHKFCKATLSYNLFSL